MYKSLRLFIERISTGINDIISIAYHNLWVLICIYNILAIYLQFSRIQRFWNVLIAGILVCFSFRMTIIYEDSKFRINVIGIIIFSVCLLIYPK